MNKWIKLLMLSWVGILFVACGVQIKQEGQKVSEKEKVETVLIKQTFKTRADKKAGIDSVEYVNEVEVMKYPKRVISFDYGTLDTLYALGLQDFVVGVAKGQTPLFSDRIKEEFSKDKYVNIGTFQEPNYEEIIKLNPDVIFVGVRTITQKHLDEFKKAVPNAKVIYMGVDMNHMLESVTERSSYIAQLYDKETEVEQYIDKITEELTNLRKKAQEKKASALVVMANEGELTAQASKGRFGWIFGEEGGGFVSVDEKLDANPHGQAISYEYIVEKNPNYLFIFDRGATLGKQSSADTISDNPLVKELEASKQGHIQLINGTNWYIAFGGLQVTLDQIAEVKAVLEK